MTFGAFGIDLDDRLRLIKEVYELKPKECIPKQIIHQSKFKLGEELFGSTLLSGDKDTSCTTCHIENKAFADGLPISVGVGGSGESKDRLYSKGVLVQRNSFTLIGRGNPLFKTFFWDGKAQEQDGKIISQFGELLPKGFSSVLSVASILPLVERDEFIGVHQVYESNELQSEVGDSLYFDRYIAIEKAIRNRIKRQDTEESKKIFLMLQEQGIDVENLKLVDIGELLSSFIKTKFKCNISRWDKYLAGSTKILSNDEKHGAIQFYGNGRCASCHSGPLMSDFKFHSIGFTQGLFGPHSRHRDIGRAGVTYRNDDLYRFRTPSLLEVSKTGPYGHNGVFDSLEDVLTHHFNPLDFYIKNKQFAETDYFQIGKTIDSRDKVLSTIELDKTSVEKIIQFLKVL